VKAFIYDHADLYKNLRVKYIGGADPEFVFIKQDGSEERIAIDELSTEEIINLVEERGFQKIENPEPPPPEDEEDFVGEEDQPGLDNYDPELNAFREGQIPAAPGMEDDIYRPAPLSPEEEKELDELRKQEL